MHATTWLKPDIAVPLGFVLFVAIVLFCSQVIGPRRRIQRFKRALTARGWREFAAVQNTAWFTFKKTAVDGVKGRERNIEYNEDFGLFREHVKMQEKQEVTIRTRLRSSSLSQTWMAACATRRTEIIERGRKPFPNLKGSHTTWSREMWWGEVRPLRVQKPILIYSTFGHFYGDFFRKLNVKRKVPDRVFPELAPQNDNRNPESLQLVFERHQRMLDAVRPKVFLAPDCWVLIASLQNAIRHLASIETFTTEFSQALNGLASKRPMKKRNGARDETGWIS